MSKKYEVLIKTLDFLCGEAPKSFVTYYPDKKNPETVIKARSLAFIHLLLKVKFGVLDFYERHQWITDGPQDGGVDAYYIDEENKKLYLIQSKFRNTSANFNSKNLAPLELIKMEVSRIIKGYREDSTGKSFNSKIITCQKRITQIRDIARYDHVVIFLGNVFKYTDEQIRRNIDNSLYEIIDCNKAYNQLLFPLATATYYDPNEIIIHLELSQKENPRLTQIVETDFGEFSVSAIFISTNEIGRVLDKYKNSILKYNPRNFLSLKKGGVNSKIRSSIVDQSHNNFAILNNGITILADNIKFSESTGRQNEGQLILTHPQILNGGQTAYILSTIYSESNGKGVNPLINKEVLVKIITPISKELEVDYKFVELISNATNQQNEVSDADQRSNHSIQIEIQQQLFNDFGYFYERKTGEYFDSVKAGIISPELLIDRQKFLKAYWAYLGKPAFARRSNEKTFYKDRYYTEIFNSDSNYRIMFFSYLLFKELENIEERYSSRFDSVEHFGNALLYGKWAVLASIGMKSPEISSNNAEMLDQVQMFINTRLDMWVDFDNYIVEKNKHTKYFLENYNFELYYKINLLDEDIKTYFHDK